MTGRDAEPPVDAIRDDLIAYLAKRLGVSHDVALSTLGNWLVDFERAQVRPERTDSQR